MKSLATAIFLLTFCLVLILAIGDFMSGGFPIGKIAILIGLGAILGGLAKGGVQPSRYTQNLAEIKATGTADKKLGTAQGNAPSIRTSRQIAYDRMAAKLAETGRHPEIAVKLAFQHVNSTPARDQDLDDFERFGGTTKVKVPIRAVIRYVSQQGEVTTRQVDILTVNAVRHRDKTVTAVAFDAFCHTKNAERSFYFRSIEAAADPTNGELIDHFASYVIDSVMKGYRVRRRRIEP